VAVCAALLVYLWLFTFALQPQGELVRETVSREGGWTASVWYVDAGGAASASAMRVEVAPTGAPGESRVVYFGSYAEPTWLDEVTLSFGTKYLDVRSERYDERTARAAGLALAWGLVGGAGLLAGVLTYLIVMLATRRPQGREPAVAVSPGSTTSASS